VATSYGFINTVGHLVIPKERHQERNVASLVIVPDKGGFIRQGLVRIQPFDRNTGIYD
jgi:hypothetical protein